MAIKKYISFLWPISRKIKTTYNGYLEINWVDGKKYLDSKNSNYSYGSLQKILDFGLKKININAVNNILLLGLGGGSIISLLRKKYKQTAKISVVEIDKVVIDIADKEFNISPTDQLEIICADAWNFCMYSKYKYNLIIVDLFIDKNVPSKFFQIEFWRKIIDLMSSHAAVIFNAGIDLTNTSELERLFSGFDQKIDFCIYRNVQESNTLLIATKKR